MKKCLTLLSTIFTGKNLMLPNFATRLQKWPPKCLWFRKFYEFQKILFKHVFLKGWTFEKWNKRNRFLDRNLLLRSFHVPTVCNIANAPTWAPKRASYFNLWVRACAARYYLHSKGGIRRNVVRRSLRVNRLSTRRLIGHGSPSRARQADLPSLDDPSKLAEPRSVSFHLHSFPYT